MGTYKQFLNRMLYTSLALIAVGSIILGCCFYYCIKYGC